MKNKMKTGGLPLGTSRFPTRTGTKTGVGTRPENFSFALRIITAVAVGLSIVCGHVSAAERPNLVLVTADDMGLQLGCYGDTVATTPNMDRLAREGARFTRSFVTQASCSSSRASLLTGLYPHQNGQIGLAHLGYSMKPGVTTLPNLLKKTGYRTGIIGKLHVEPESAFDFDTKWTDIEATRDMSRLRSMCDAFLDNSIGKPFFLYINLFDPHAPFLRDVQGSPKTKVGREQVRVFPFIGSDSPELRQDLADYYTCVNRVDEAVGEIMGALKRHGLGASTFVVVMGDNGPPFPRAKCTLFEAGTLVPLIAWCPDRVKPRICEQLVGETDLMPTFLELAGATTPAGLAGRSLLPLLDGQSVKWRDFLVTEYTTHEPRMLDPGRGIRDMRYKLTVSLLKDPAFSWPEEIPPEEYRKVQSMAGTGEFIELHDLKEDPCEFKNLAGQPGLKAVQERLLGELKKWREETRDPLLDPAALRKLMLSEKDAPPTRAIIEKLVAEQKQAIKAGHPNPSTISPEALRELRAMPGQN